MSKILKQARASLKLLEATRISPANFRKAKDKAKERLKEVPGRIRNLAFASQEEVDELRRRIEALESQLGMKEARSGFVHEDRPENRSIPNS